MTNVILGGGIGGLSAAYYLKKLNSAAKVIILESSSRLGGWINSEKLNSGENLEFGPRTLRAGGFQSENTLSLAEALNLNDKIRHINYDHPATKNRMIYVDGNLHKLPNNFSSVIKKSPPFSKPLLVHIFNELRQPCVINNDESLYSFVNRRFGSEVAQYVIDPLVRGIFAGNAKDLSVTCIARRFYNLEKKYGSVIKGLVQDKEMGKFDSDIALSKLVGRARKDKWNIWYFEGGIITLVDALRKKCIEDGIEIIIDAPVSKIDKPNKGKLQVHGKFDTIECDNVISCIPANHLAPIINSLNKDVSKLLYQIPFVNVTVVNLVYSGDVLSSPGFGYLVPSNQSSKVLGVIYDSCVFDTPGKTVFTVMMGGYWFDKYFGNQFTSDEFLKLAINEISSTLKVNDDPIYSKVSILQNCIPQYTVGHDERVYNARKILKDLKTNFYLAGNSYDGVGINDTILSSKDRVFELLKNI